MRRTTLIKRKLQYAIIGLTFGASCLLMAPVNAQTAMQNAAVVSYPNFNRIYEQNKDAVVNIRSIKKIKLIQRRGGSDLDELFRHFFGDDFFGGFGEMPYGQDGGDDGEVERAAGLGSGFILTSDGYIMTNAHVVSGADDLIVTLTNKKEYEAKLIGLDKRTDVAIVKINATGLPVVKIGNVGNLKVGEWVVAIGSPFGLENTLTAGIVSAKKRDTGEFLPFIQTDVAINPGNSGGPLINMHGEVVGINSQIYSRTGGSMGISFAIPIDEAMRVGNQIRTTGSVERGRLGVVISPLEKKQAESMGIKNANGAFIADVERGSAAEKAGIEAGDVVVAINGREIESYSELRRIIGSTKPNTAVKLTIVRDGKARVVTAKIDRLTDDADRGRTGTDKPQLSQGEKNLPNLGLVVRDLTAQEKQQYRVRGGAYVVSAQGVSASVGIARGSVIVSINNQRVNDAAAAQQLAQKLAPNKPAGILLRRLDGSMYVVVTPTKK